MSKIKDGGAAFPGRHTGPHPTRAEEKVEYWTNGMSLRDYFAGQALQGILANQFPYDDVPREAYKYADDMLKMREVSE